METLKRMSHRVAGDRARSALQARQAQRAPVGSGIRSRALDAGTAQGESDRVGKRRGQRRTVGIMAAKNVRMAGLGAALRGARNNICWRRETPLCGTR